VRSAPWRALAPRVTRSSSCCPCQGSPAMTDLLPEHVNQLSLRVHGASAVLMMAPRSNDEFGDREAAAALSTAVLHRGAHGLRVRSLICVDPQLENSFRVLFPVTAPDSCVAPGRCSLSPSRSTIRCLVPPGPCRRWSYGMGGLRLRPSRSSLITVELSSSVSTASSVSVRLWGLASYFTRRWANR
jgi:hypothetical protein